MCGFSGWVFNTNAKTDTIVSSLQSIKHRGPDDSLIVAGDNAHFYSCHLSNQHTKNTYPQLDSPLSKTCFGFNRLSIVDLSDNAMQPFYDKELNLLFMMNGEIYNYVELRKEFVNDCKFVSESDSEVAFHLFKKLGHAFVEKLQGMFSIVIYNYNTNTLNVWRDRLGIKPFYYTLTSQGFIFSSEIKGLLASGWVNKEINYMGLAYSMYLGTCPSPLTIYENIYSLQAGHYLEFEAQSMNLKTKPYWNLVYQENKNEITTDEFISDMQNICRLYATGDVNKALMLSGGLDSGTLAYFYGKYDKSIEGIHIYPKNEDSEFEFAQLNAKNADIAIHNYEIPFTFKPEEWELFLQSEEEPNACPEPALVLCEKISNKNIKVLYNALGPDEVFGGYGYYQKMKKLSNYKALFNLPLFVFPKKNRHKIAEIKKYGLESFPFITRQLFTWEEIGQFLISNNKPIPEHPIAFIKKQIESLYPDFTKIPLLKKASYFDLFYYISSHHTFRSDQPSMKYSIEMRFPFLEHTFIEKYFNQSHTFNEISVHLKPQFRTYIKSLLPNQVLTMKKKGFTIPIDTILPSNEKNNSNQQWYLLMRKKIFDY